MKKLLTLLVVLLCPAAYGEDAPPGKSLFLNPDESRLAKALAQRNGPPGADIHLGAVMYYSPEDWVLWLQNERWTPATAHDDLKILEVTSEHVRLSWKGDEDEHPREIDLMPNETYEIASGKVTSSQ